MTRGMARDDSDDLLDRVDRIDVKVSALLALALETHLRTTGAKTKKRTIDRLLADAGLPAAMIARLLGKTPRAVHLALQKQRSKRTTKNRRGSTQTHK